jgi:superfamily II DNA or RNA helicase
VFEINVYPTHISVSNAKEASIKLGKLLELFEYEDEYEEVINTLGYVINEQQDILYFNKGVDVEYIKKTLVDAKVTVHEAPEPAEMLFEYEEIIPPRDDEQVEMINFVSASNEWARTKNSPQVFMVAKTGVGKTFTSCVGAALYKKKTLIICHRAELLKQWRATLIEKIGMADSDIHTLTTEDFLAAEELELDLADVYLLSHQTFRFALKAVGGYFERIAKAIENLGMGLKIIDEAHLEFHNIILIDMSMNIKRDLYLTASD